MCLSIPKSVKKINKRYNKFVPIANTGNLVDFTAELAQTGQEVALGVKLVNMARDLQPPPLICANCQKTPCMSGTPITNRQQIRVGSVVTTNEGTELYYDCGEARRRYNGGGEGKAKVDYVDPHMIWYTVKSCQGYDDYFDEAISYSVLDYYGTPNFCFSCGISWMDVLSSV